MIKYVLLLSGLFLACQKSPQSNEYYQEEHRPLFHFTPPKGWMNDPNGLVYYEGEYHLFYQHYPDSTVWGPMHWGHAVSKDLVSWEHLPIALYPDSLGYIFSGSVVVDENNTSGFQTGKEKPLVAIFTYHDMVKEKAGRNDRESQGIAYSLDKGRTWVKYQKNPVIPNKGDTDFRDPKVFWHEPSKHWVMPLAVGQHLEIFTSPNLKDWAKTGSFGEKEGAHGGVWECPDILSFQTSEGEKWVLIQNIGRGAVNGGSGTQYFVGHFDGKTFVNENSPTTTLWLDYGADNYAGVSWFNAPNDKKIYIGWMSNWDDYATKVPTSTWRSGMTVPRELSLIKTDQGYRLSQKPIDNLEKIRKKQEKISPTLVEKEKILDSKAILKEIELTFDLKNSTANEFGIEIYNDKNEKVVLGFDKKLNQVFIDRTKSGKTDFSDKFAKIHSAPISPNGVVKFHVLIDVASVELFVNDGEVALTDLFFPNESFKNCKIYTKKGSANVVSGNVYALKSIWEK